MYGTIIATPLPTLYSTALVQVTWNQLGNPPRRPDMPPYRDNYEKLEDGTDWPSRHELTALMEEDGIDALTGGAGIAKLVDLLGSSVTAGLSGTEDDLKARRAAFGENAFASKKLKSYCSLVMDGLHDMTIILLIFMSIVSLVVETFFGEHPETGWIESVAIMISVTIIVNVAAATDYVKERMFESLSKQLDQANTKAIIRNGQRMEVQDDDLVVGDLLSFNSHNFASIPCDGLLVSGAGVKMDESSLTGEPEPQVKTTAHPFIVSGTAAVSGSGQMVVIAVGPNSVSGKIKAAVYGDTPDDEGSPLFQVPSASSLRSPPFPTCLHTPTSPHSGHMHAAPHAGGRATRHAHLAVNRNSTLW